MLLLKVAYEGEENIIDEIQEFRKYLKSKNVVIGICESIEGNTHFIKILCDEGEYSDKLRDMVNMCMSNIIYKIIINIFKKKEMFELLNDAYFFLKREELLDVEEKITEALSLKKLKDEEDVFCLNRINSIISKIKECIEEKGEININGFVTFRMKELFNDIETIVDKVVEKYMVEREYNEFIKLLKYFVDIQESKIPLINLSILSGGEYEIKDSSGKDIFNEFANELLDYKANNGGINIEDVIISGLITNSPDSIVIHGEDNCTNKELLLTINNVFGERVQYCKGCGLCQSKNIMKNVDTNKTN